VPNIATSNKKHSPISFVRAIQKYRKNRVFVEAEEGEGIPSVNVKIATYGRRCEKKET
jgi:hypothetical protein